MVSMDKTIVHWLYYFSNKKFKAINTRENIAFPRGR